MAALAVLCLDTVPVADQPQLIHTSQSASPAGTPREADLRLLAAQMAKHAQQCADMAVLVADLVTHIGEPNENPSSS